MKIKIEKLPVSELENKKITDWPIWTCEPSTFDWHYDRQEECYILEGEVTVRTGEEEIRIKPGDFVTFPKGLDCQWEVNKTIRKHYYFS